MRKKGKPNNRDEVAGRVCWYCGLRKMQGLSGHTIGEMAYSSSIHFSSDRVCASEKLSDSSLDSLESGLWICDTCLELCSRELPKLDSAYVEFFASERNVQEQEIADRDTFLVAWYEMSRPFGCWLTGLPEVGPRDRFFCLPIGMLYENGWRLRGRIKIEDKAARRLMQRYGGDPLNPGPSREFVNHVKTHIVFDDDEFASQLYTLRAEIFDVSVYFALNSNHEKADHPPQ
jgi:hypothetical protein